jgi:hypothetical protein
MFYILTQPGQAAVYPYTLTDLRRDNRDVSFPRDMAGFDTTPYHCHPVQPTVAPSAPGKAAERAAPELVDGVWQERWTLVDVPPPPVPGRVTMRQARLALLGIGLLDAVEPALAAIADPVERRAAEITWEYSIEVQRSNPLISALAAGLGLTEADLDNLFRSAALL